jgi:hypothetical protein
LLSHQGRKEQQQNKKESGDSFVNAIWGCGSSATYFQPSVIADFIYADLRNELYTPLDTQALFV